MLWTGQIESQSIIDTRQKTLRSLIGQIRVLLSEDHIIELNCCALVNSCAWPRTKYQSYFAGVRIERVVHTVWGWSTAAYGLTRDCNLQYYKRLFLFHGKAVWYLIFWTEFFIHYIISYMYSICAL